MFAVFFCLEFKTKNSYLLPPLCSRTPGSRQPSPAEEAITRPNNLLDGQPPVGSFQQHPLQHMLGGDHQGNHLGSYHPQMQMNQMQGPVMNGVGGMHQNQMMNQPQGMNQVDSSANLLQQQHNFDVQVRASFFYRLYLLLLTILMMIRL